MKLFMIACTLVLHQTLAQHKEVLYDTVGNIYNKFDHENDPFFAPFRNQQFQFKSHYAKADAEPIVVTKEDNLSSFANPARDSTPNFVNHNEPLAYRQDAPPPVTLAPRPRLEPLREVAIQRNTPQRLDYEETFTQQEAQRQNQNDYNEYSRNTERPREVHFDNNFQQQKPQPELQRQNQNDYNEYSRNTERPREVHFDNNFQQQRPQPDLQRQNKNDYNDYNRNTERPRESENTRRFENTLPTLRPIPPLRFR